MKYISESLTACEVLAQFKPEDIPTAMLEKWAAAYDDIQGLDFSYGEYGEYDDIAGCLEHLRDNLPSNREKEMLADFPEYYQFFHDCFARLAMEYPSPSVTSDYDRAVIFDAIEAGEKVDHD